MILRRNICSNVAIHIYAVLINGQPGHNRIYSQSLVLFPTKVTYVELCYIEHFSANKSDKFEGIGLTLWSVMVIYNALKGFQIVPCW